MGSYDVDAYGAEVRVRAAGIVVLLHAVTLGLYNPYWYWSVNRELRDFGRVYRLRRCAACNPWLALAAVTLLPLLVLSIAIALALVVAPRGSVERSGGVLELVLLGGILVALLSPVVSWHRTTKRIQEAQSVVGHSPLSGIAVGFACAGGLVFTPAWLVIPYLVQSDLNAVWTAFAQLDPETGRAPERVRVSIGALESLPEARGWDLSAIADEDREAIGELLATRESLGGILRARRASALEERVRPKVPDASAEHEAERLLELVYVASDGP